MEEERDTIPDRVEVAHAVADFVVRVELVADCDVLLDMVP